MVTVVVGKLGSGKSYDTVRTMVEHIRRGGAVRTNIKLDYRYIGQCLQRSLASWQIGTLDQDTDPATIPIGDRRGRGRRRVLVVLDEALNWFDSSGAKDDPRKASWGRWLRQSDKLGQDVFFIAQNFERAAKWIRELAQQCVDIVGLRGISWLGIPWGRLPGLRNVYARRVVDVRTERVLSWGFRVYSSYYWRFYDTSETFGFDAAESAYSAGIVYPMHRPVAWPWPIAAAILVFELFLWGVL